MRVSSRRRRGAGMTEYIIIVGLIGIGLTGIVRAFGGKLGETMVGTENAGRMGLVAATEHATGQKPPVGADGNPADPLDFGPMPATPPPQPGPPPKPPEDDPQ